MLDSVRERDEAAEDVPQAGGDSVARMPHGAGPESDHALLHRQHLFTAGRVKRRCSHLTTPCPIGRTAVGSTLKIYPADPNSSGSALPQPQPMQPMPPPPPPQGEAEQDGAGDAPPLEEPCEALKNSRQDGRNR